jgi:hypothetical protein
MATKQPPYEAAVDLCGRLHLPVPYSPMSDANGDREAEMMRAAQKRKTPQSILTS